MDRIECSICNHCYDDDVHRPRVLPCGHGFCTLCIDESISRGNKTCLVCREEHVANSAADFPVNFVLEEFLHKANAESASENVTLDSSFEMEISGMCQKHSGIPLYFYCKTHSTKVCASCMIHDHPPVSCNLISVEGEIKERKQSQIVKIQDRKQDLMDTEKDFETLLKRGIDYLSEKNNKKQELENEKQNLCKKIEQIKREIGNKEKFQTQIKNAIQDCQKKQQCFDVMENKVKNAMSNQDIVKQCKNTETEILQIEKWEDNQRKALNIMKVSEEGNKYAQVTRKGIQRSSKIFMEVGRTFIPSLSKNLKLPSDAQIIKEAEIFSPDNTIVFMDLSGNGHFLGRIYLRIFSSTSHGKQFIMLALGTNGGTFKGAKFAEQSRIHIDLKDFVTEQGISRKEALPKFMKREENPGKQLRGRIFFSCSSSHNGTTPLSLEIYLIDLNSSPQEWGYIGDVISGMDIIDRSIDEYAKEQIGKHKKDISDITINECGIVLNY